MDSGWGDQGAGPVHQGRAHYECQARRRGGGSGEDYVIQCYRFAILFDEILSKYIDCIIEERLRVIDG